MKSTHPKEIKPVIKIGTKREALFIEVRDISRKRISDLEKELEIQKEMLCLAERIIAEEEKK